MDDLEAMTRCLKLARKSGDEGDFPFGSVITDPEGNLLGEGRNREVTQVDPTWHAETDAIRAALRRVGEGSLEGCTIYASGEPCLMCSYIIRKVGIARVVYAARSASPSRVEPHPLLDEDLGQYPVPLVEAGLMEQESLKVQGRV